jgi:hypothetical protein
VAAQSPYFVIAANTAMPIALMRASLPRYAALVKKWGTPYFFTS